MESIVRDKEWVKENIKNKVKCLEMLRYLTTEERDRKFYLQGDDIYVSVRSGTSV